jgi:DNA replication protein DnaD
MKEGWVSIHRKILEDSLWLVGTLTQKLLMVTLVLMANAKSKEWIWDGNKCHVKRGQLITSLESLKEILGKDVTVKQIRTALKNLEKYGFLTNQSTKTGRLITLLNYSKYQDNQKGSDKEVDKDMTKKCQSSDKEGSPNNKYNKDNKEIKKIPKSSSSLNNGGKINYGCYLQYNQRNYSRNQIEKLEEKFYKA